WLPRRVRFPTLLLVTYAAAVAVLAIAVPYRPRAVLNCPVFLADNNMGHFPEVGVAPDLSVVAAAPWAGEGLVWRPGQSADPVLRIPRAPGPDGSAGFGNELLRLQGHWLALIWADVKDDVCALWNMVEGKQVARHKAPDAWISAGHTSRLAQLSPDGRTI